MLNVPSNCGIIFSALLYISLLYWPSLLCTCALYLPSILYF